MSTERVVFVKVSRQYVKACRCAKCREPVRRQRTFFQTLSPFNLHELTKVPKDRAQIERELREQGAAWIRAAELCATCEEAEE